MILLVFLSTVCFKSSTGKTLIQGNRLKPKNCHAPRLTGLPKVHKEGVPIRGIVSMIGSPFEKGDKLSKNVKKNYLIGQH